jgi:hypothetical protein
MAIGVRHSQKARNTGGTVVLTPSTPHVAGNTIVLAVMSATLNPIDTLADAGGNLYTEVFPTGGPEEIGTGNLNLRVYVSDGANASGAITVTFDSVGSGVLAYYEVTDVFASPLDASATATGSAASVSGALTTSAAATLAIAAYAREDGGGAPGTPDGTFTTASLEESATGYTGTLRMKATVYGSAGAKTFTDTFGAGAAWALTLLSLAGESTPPPTTKRRLMMVGVGR